MTSTLPLPLPPLTSPLVDPPDPFTSVSETSLFSSKFNDCSRWNEGASLSVVRAASSDRHAPPSFASPLEDDAVRESETPDAVVVVAPGVSVDAVETDVRDDVVEVEAPVVVVFESLDNGLLFSSSTFSIPLPRPNELAAAKLLFANADRMEEN